MVTRLEVLLAAPLVPRSRVRSVMNRQASWRTLATSLVSVVVLCVLVVFGDGHWWGISPVVAVLIVCGTAVGVSLRNARKHRQDKDYE